MSLFGLYRTLRENQEKKNNFLATVVEGPDSGDRLLFSEGQLKSVYGDISLTPEQQEYLTEAGQSQLTDVENRKSAKYWLRLFPGEVLHREKSEPYRYSWKCYKIKNTILQ